MLHSHDVYLFKLNIAELLTEQVCLSGIISRETRAGKVLPAGGWSGDGSAFGLMQVRIGLINMFVKFVQAKLTSFESKKISIQ